MLADPFSSFAFISTATSVYAFRESEDRRLATLLKLEEYIKPDTGLSIIEDGMIAFDFNGASAEPNSPKLN
jgi:hypothetical protein